MTDRIETQLTTVERDLVVYLLRNYGNQVAASGNYMPDTISNPVMLSVCNSALALFGESPIKSSEVES